jgi:ribose transport system ATP-binding protein
VFKNYKEGIEMEQPILHMHNINKTFPGVTALKSVDFDLMKGEVHALVGENGAGKSTLIKILSGAIPKTSGEIYINGEQVEITNPLQAQTLGIAVIYQELMLAPALSAAENILLGRLPRRWGIFIDRKKLFTTARQLTTMLGLKIDLSLPLQWLTIAQQQMVEVAKALSLNAKIIVMDEPSAVLTPHELDKLFQVISQLKKEHVSFIYISHRLDEIFRIADRVTVLKDGEVQGTRLISEVTRPQMINMMVGREIKSTEVKHAAKPDRKVVMEVKDLQSEYLKKSVSLKLYQGEILGIAGLVGAGRSELVRAIFGADKRISGQIFIEGNAVAINSPVDAVQLGMGLVPEDRKHQGLLSDMSVTENITVTNLQNLTKIGFIKKRREIDTASSLVERLKIRLSSIHQSINSLSGGNQQKVILARWLGSSARIIFFDEPTRGIDVAAKAQIHQLMRELIQHGASIIMISSELPEILEMSDRIIVMHEGKITGELSREEATEQNIISLATQ